MTIKVEVKNLYKVFGDQPKKALQLLQSGQDKDEIFNKTGMTIGVKDANLQIEEGEIFVVMGLSGSGKSTLVRLLNRLIEPTQGEVLIDGEDITKMDTHGLREVRRKKISMVFQSFALMPHLNVLENAAFGLELSGVDVSERQEAALAALAQVGLEAYPDSYPDELSGGMQQRVGLARALANDPDIMLMDEAFSALDPLIRTEMQDELVQLQAKHQRTIIFISHDLDEAMRIGDRIAIMQGGEVVQVGAPDDILHNPANDYVRSFFRGVDVSNVFTAGDIAQKKQVTLIKKQADGGLRSGLKQLQDNDREYGYVVDKAGSFMGAVSADSLNSVIKEEKTLEQAYLDIQPLPSDMAIKETLGAVAQGPCPIPVVDEANKYLGVISRTILLETLDREEDV
ncbi:glycine betaine/L-proline ABC transporter ATP-binding protein [Oleiphilus sp. HI0071]|jgi:glycine betaine/proline transport system ATP-binding protein|nr:MULTISPECIES: glycine betaine/L-proline ABC transporter ATP-binding protein ProV [unclassified Oleiphilus]KZY67258.1 glycine betaine/L-proline ABC transporter ATP-binding protein [Oleiphilus sp. HI0065]KZY78924.1 glycine betaine/L-proline ABC transporter ATP-binding protein [Oleiphilus sp. HI0071]KZY91867.1 glycine betaine/L-proline ABC transporter ATP-binding protein [Oleiphilus sp. HI0073]KZZ49817.1 glycine betaine/L-proline ABC transporter ATP-binding protein [Oleiphilus sp. HI0118]KZZ57